MHIIIIIIIKVLMLCLFCTSCNRKTKKLETPNITFKLGEKMKFTHNLRNLKHRHPQIYNDLYSQNKPTYVYVIRQNDPNWIDKYDMSSEKVDSFIIPEEVFQGIPQRIENFSVIGLDTFNVQSAYESNKGTVFFEFSKDY